MAENKHAAHGGYSPEMDGQTHESTYTGFIRFVEIGTAVVLCWVLALAIGGVKLAWVSAIIGVILSIIAGAVGATTSLGWRAPGAIVALMLLMLILY